MASSLKVYSYLPSQPGRAVLLLLRVNNISYEYEHVDLLQGAQHKEEYMKINPMHKVPMLEHNGFIITEGGAILRYLCSASGFEIPDHWYPQKNHKARARIDEYLSWEHTGLRKAGTLVLVTASKQPYLKLLLRGPDEDNEILVERYSKDLHVALNQMENYFLKESPYLGGEDISIADLQAVCHLDHPMAVGYPVFQGRPKLKAWFDRVTATLQPHYDEVKGTCYEDFCKGYQKREFAFNYEEDWKCPSM